jgi:HJR/Mrr/RecB family endonuclease
VSFPSLTLVDGLSGQAFEEFLVALFTIIGLKVTKTPQSSDYGVDLIIDSDTLKCAIQAKRYKDNVGIAGVQQLHSGMAYYDCPIGMLITTSAVSRNAMELAAKTGIVIIEREGLRCLVDRFTDGFVLMPRVAKEISATSYDADACPWLGEARLRTRQIWRTRS